MLIHSKYVAPLRLYHISASCILIVAAFLIYIQLLLFLALHLSYPSAGPGNCLGAGSSSDLLPYFFAFNHPRRRPLRLIRFKCVIANNLHQTLPPPLAKN